MNAYMQLIRMLKHNRRGSVLIVGLFTLALLSLLGAAATTTSRTDVSITGNANTLQEAFYAAEVGLANGEMQVNQKVDPRNFPTDIPGFYDAEEKPNWKVMNWDDKDSVLIDDLDLSNALDHLYERPRYLIKQTPLKLDDPRARDKLKKFSQGTSRVSGYNYNGLTNPIFYEIYAKGTGGSSKTQSVLQSVFVKPSD
jgi:Tfp pilus assembly protein PilX